MDNNALGKAIRKARGDLSLRDYAKKIGISHTHLDSIEKGYDPRTGKPVTISLDTFVKLSDATGIPLEELLFMLKYNLNDLEAIEEKPATSRTPIESMLLRYFSNDASQFGKHLQAKIQEQVNSESNSSLLLEQMNELFNNVSKLSETEQKAFCTGLVKGIERWENEQKGE